MLARVGGYPVGIIANQSAQMAGCIDINAADKAAGFIRVCDSFNIPLLNLVDVSGFYPGKEQVKSTSTAASALITAISAPGHA